MRYKWLVGSLAGALVVLALSPPLQATAAGPSASLDVTFGSTCSGGGSVSYTWSGFHNVGDAGISVHDDTASTYLIASAELTTAGSGTYGPFTFNEVNGHHYTIVGDLEPTDTSKKPIHPSVVTTTRVASCS